MTTSVDRELADCRGTLDRFLEAAAACEARWARPVRDGKWSPSQIVEHVARAYDANASDLLGEPSPLPSLPAPLRFVARKMVFDRAARNGTLPRAKTNRAMDPERGPDTPEAGRQRIDAAWARFEHAARATPGRARSSVFGEVEITDFVRFQAVHTRHHQGQFEAS